MDQGINTAATYISTLNDYLLPEIEAAECLVTFQQDNARIHKTAAVLSFLEKNHINTFEWPPQSPDLSLIENICHEDEVEGNEASSKDLCENEGRNVRNLGRAYG